MRAVLVPVVLAISSFSFPTCTQRGQTAQSNATFDVVKSWLQRSLAIKISMISEDGKKTDQGTINVSNLDTGYPFVIIELALKGDDLKFKTSDASLVDAHGKEYKLGGTAAFSIDNYNPLPPKKGTIFDLYPLVQTDDSGGTVSVNWIEGSEDIGVAAKGKGTRILLVFDAPKADAYKLSLPGSAPISIKPIEESPQ